MVDGVLRGKTSGRDIRAFLATHHPPPRPGQIEALHRLLRRHAEAAGQFRERCAICHDHARELARLELIIVDGRLRGRYTGRDIREFLVNHGRLDTAGVEFFVDLLSRMVRETASGDWAPSGRCIDSTKRKIFLYVERLFSRRARISVTARCGPGREAPRRPWGWGR